MKKLITLVFVSCFGLSSWANLSNEQLQAGICIIANQGIHTVATERQAGTSKQNAKVKLDKELVELKRRFKNPRFVQGIQGVWYRALDTVYQKPVYKTQAEKDAFVSGITQEAFTSCMESLSR